MEFFLPFLLLSFFFVFSSRSYTSSWLRGVVVRGVSLAKVLSSRVKFGDIFGARSVAFGWFSLDTRSSVVVAGFFRSGFVKPRTWWSHLLVTWPTRERENSFLPLLACEGHSLSFPVVVGGDRWFWM
jgi:hypothetical protein